VNLVFYVKTNGLKDILSVIKGNGAAAAQQGINTLPTFGYGVYIAIPYGIFLEKNLGIISAYRKGLHTDCGYAGIYIALRVNQIPAVMGMAERIHRAWGRLGGDGVYNGAKGTQQAVFPLAHGNIRLNIRLIQL
jgi:hypothetical protein